MAGGVGELQLFRKRIWVVEAHVSILQVKIVESVGSSRVSGGDPQCALSKVVQVDDVLDGQKRVLIPRRDPSSELVGSHRPILKCRLPGQYR